LLAGVRELPVEVIVTVGREIDPAELGHQPPHVRVQRYLPQASVLPRCSVMVSHGGSGSVLGALAFGVASVLTPLGADQIGNAERCLSLGVARVLDPIASTPGDIGAAIMDVRSTPSYGLTAASLRKEIEALPDSRYAAELLERLA
jgi:UDP:flavonoid glycosyltransferase YjiC (YdhE family)